MTLCARMLFLEKLHPAASTNCIDEQYCCAVMSEERIVLVFVCFEVINPSKKMHCVLMPRADSEMQRKCVHEISKT